MTRAFSPYRALDQALDDLRDGGVGVVWPYLLGMVPFTLVAAGLVEAWVWRRSDWLPWVGAGLALASPFRWLGRAETQRRLLERQGRFCQPLRARWRAILATSAVDAPLTGLMLFVPFAGAFVWMSRSLTTPALLGSEGPTWPLWWRDLPKKAMASWYPLLWTALTLLLGFALLLLNLSMLVMFLLKFAVPALTGLEAPVATRVFSSPTFLWGGLYLSFLAMDLLAGVTAVRVNAMLNDVRDGGDLRLRLAALERDAAAARDVFPDADADADGGGTTLAFRSDGTAVTREERR